MFDGGDASAASVGDESPDRRPSGLRRRGGFGPAAVLLGLALLIPGSPSAAPVVAEPVGTPQVTAASPSRAELRDRLETHVRTLASPELEGRLTGSEGAARATRYLADELAEIGARPLPGRERYRLPFEFTAGVEDGGSSIALHDAGGAREGGPSEEGPGREPPGEGGVSIPGEGTLTGSGYREAGAVRALSFSTSGTVRGPVVFAGYGVTVPESAELPYDSYAGLDVEGKIVVVLRYAPREADRDVRATLARYSGLRYKAMRARELGAEALLVLTGPRSPDAGELVPMAFDAAISGSGIVAASIDGEVGRAVLERAGDRDLEEIQAELDTGDPHVGGFEIPGLEIEVDVRVVRERRTGHNVAGRLPAAPPSSDDRTGPAERAPAADEEWGYVALGAHYDHLGRGGNGNSLARKGEAGSVHHGADDNASGVATVLEVGRALSRRPPSRPVILAFWSGEELGLLGSSEFVDDPPVPLERIAAYLNFDMVGRLREHRLVAQSVGSSPAWRGLLERTNVVTGFALVLQDDPYLPTDSSAFYQAGIPALSFFTGSHEDYHRPTDEAARVDFDGLERIVRFGTLLVRRLSDLPRAPRYTQVARESAPAADRDSARAFTGTIPDYTTEVEGLRLSGVVEAGPADAAGLREGDVIVELAGRTITNIYDYTYALDAVKIGEPVTVVFLRDGERREVEIVPEARR